MGILGRCICKERLQQHRKQKEEQLELFPTEFQPPGTEQKVL